MDADDISKIMAIYLAIFGIALLSYNFVSALIAFIGAGFLFLFSYDIHKLIWRGYLKAKSDNKGDKNDG